MVPVKRLQLVMACSWDLMSEAAISACLPQTTSDQWCWSFAMTPCLFLRSASATRPGS